MEGKIKWIKISVDMFDDEKIKIIEEKPEGDTILVIWMKLLLLAGKINNNGYIYLSADLPFTVESLATVLNRPLNTVRLALDLLCGYKMIEVNGQGTIYLVNWARYQNIEGMEKIREQNRARQKAFYDRHKSRELPLLSQPNVSLAFSNAPRGGGEEEDKNKDITPYSPPLEKGGVETKNILEEDNVREPDPEAIKIWGRVLESLKKQVSAANYRTWLKDTKGIQSGSGEFVINIPNSFVEEHLERNLKSLIEKTLAGELGGPVKLRIKVKSQGGIR